MCQNVWIFCGFVGRLPVELILKFEENKNEEISNQLAVDMFYASD